MLERLSSDLKAEGIRSCCWSCEEKLHGSTASSRFPPIQLSLLKSGRSPPPKSFPPESDWKMLKHTTKVLHDFGCKRTVKKHHHSCHFYEIVSKTTVVWSLIKKSNTEGDDALNPNRLWFESKVKSGPLIKLLRNANMFTFIVTG